jgi:hypothetical protein
VNRRRSGSAPGGKIFIVTTSGDPAEVIGHFTDAMEAKTGGVYFHPSYDRAAGTVPSWLS